VTFPLKNPKEKNHKILAISCIAATHGYKNEMRSPQQKHNEFAPERCFNIAAHLE